MKKLILSVLLCTAVATSSAHPVIESFQKYPYWYAAGIAAVVNLDRRYVQPNFWGGLSAATVFMLHRILGGNSHPLLSAGAYVGGAALSKIVTRPLHNKWESIKRWCKYTWQNK